MKINGMALLGLSSFRERPIFKAKFEQKILCHNEMLNFTMNYCFKHCLTKCDHYLRIEEIRNRRKNK